MRDGCAPDLYRAIRPDGYGSLGLTESERAAVLRSFPKAAEIGGMPDYACVIHGVAAYVAQPSGSVVSG